MGEFIKGDIVVIPFPFSDLSNSKRRPALVLSKLQGEDIILCQITSKELKDKYAIAFEDKDFLQGGLKQSSNIRPNRIFTADSNIVLYKVGHLKQNLINDIIQKVIEIIRN